MKITRQQVARKLADYLDGKIPVEALVDWAENAMADGIFPPEESAATDSEKRPGFQVLAQAVARLGLADVRAFGLTWEDCQEVFRTLGLSAKIELVAA